MASKQREVRMLEITSAEVKQLDGNCRLYEGVGKMGAPQSTLWSSQTRFLLTKNWQVCIQSDKRRGEEAIVGYGGAQV